MTQTQHTPVLLAETLLYLNPLLDGWYLDGTLGGGGHADAVLRASAPSGVVVGFDRDEQALERTVRRLAGYGDRFHACHASFAEAMAIWHERGYPQPNGMLLDLGLSSDQLGDTERGFSFQVDAPLDLRFDVSSGASAAELLRRISEQELTEILGTYGELRAPRQLARQILAYRLHHPILRTNDLIEASGLKHPRRLAQLFQAMRIATNDELTIVQRALPELWAGLAPGGRLVVLTFHSLEDRIVKHFMKNLAVAGAAQLLTKKPVVAGPEELLHNPRARSAKLRAIEKTKEVRGNASTKKRNSGR